MSLLRLLNPNQVLNRQADITHALHDAGVEVRFFPSAPAPIAVVEATPKAAPDWRAHVEHVLGDVAWLESPHPLVERAEGQETTVVDVDGVPLGGDAFVVMAGPCAVEDEAQLMACAHAVRDAGGQLLRGGAFKPRTSPYRFDGLKHVGLEMLQVAKQETGLRVVTEVLSEGDVDAVSRAADLLQVGARNMQNFALLHAVARQQKPVLLKRGFGCTVDETLHAAEHLLAHGANGVVLMERGVRTFEDATRFTFDANAVALMKARAHLPVFVDPSHATGRRELLLPVARAGAALGADGVMLEVHPAPAEAKSDGKQSLPLSQLSPLLHDLKPVVHAMGRTLTSDDVHVDH